MERKNETREGKTKKRAPPEQFADGLWYNFKNKKGSNY